MKKSLIILAGFILLTLSNAFARRVPVSTAQQVALRLTEMKGISSPDQALPIESIRPDLENGDEAFFIVRLRPSGFVLVAAEDNVYPVLGYSFTQDFPEGRMPEHVAAWFEGYRNEILYHRAQATEPTENIRHAWDRLTADAEQGQTEDRTGVDPLLISTWDQGSHYNAMCPPDAGGPGGRVYAGCVATAMAQVMYYYRHPAVGTGSYSYFHPDYGTLSADFGNTSYRWEEMLNSIQGPNDAVAELLYHCGVAVDMGYSPSGSGAYSSDAAMALRTYFGYSSSTQLVYKNSYSDEAWKELLRTQLDAGKPMYYHGYGSGGHAFNVDGYQDADHFHFNWGWSGSYNGYYYLTNLNPGGSNFTNGQGAIINIEPAGNYPPHCTGNHLLTALQGTFEDGSGPIASYQANADCSWLIAPQQAPEDTISFITLHFDRFDTENAMDEVRVYDGASTAAPLLATFSGNSLPQSVTTEGNQMLVTFTSNSSNEANGFYASYEATIPDFCEKNPVVFRDSSGTISDGSGIKNYNNRTICHWAIQPDGAQAVVLSFTEFDTEPQVDFVEVYAYEPSTGNGTLLGKYSGNTLPPAIISNTGAMFITFFTNGAITHAGWKASYSVSAVGMEEEQQDQMKVFPNPASDRLFIQLTSRAPAHVQLLDSRGKLVNGTTFQYTSDHIIMDVGEAGPGLYLLEVLQGAERMTKKIILR